MVSALGKRSVEIGAIVDTISNISDQTNCSFEEEAQSISAATEEQAATMHEVSDSSSKLAKLAQNMQDEPYSHLHICIGDEQGRAYGGHLNEAVISATAEIVLTKLPGKIDRVKSPEIGLNVWKL